ncbi:MAG TPA: hypothetical protein DCP69_08075 [Candidatus Omnitrophica bacterium]|nr:hypothetical protein [Candidatus Omnitrophota bacterium]
MNILELTAGDTKPTKCQYTENLTGHVIVLQIGYPTPLQKVAVITSAIGGTFEFPWAINDLQQGEWDADLIITDADGKMETTDKFRINIEGRIA